MKKLLKKMGWIRQSGRIDVGEILFDIIAVSFLVLVFWAWSQN